MDEIIPKGGEILTIERMNKLKCRACSTCYKEIYSEYAYKKVLCENIVIPDNGMLYDLCIESGLFGNENKTGQFFVHSYDEI